ncbi:MAG: hypothetical protein NVS3B7_11200 [Candidatus Elarobacter sp.]
MVDAYRYLCARGAKKFKRPYNDRSDLEQVAAVGLIKAAANYRPEMQTRFATYAWIMIVGELMHYTRDLERLVRLPRTLYDLEPRYVDAWDRFTATQHREPTATELAATLGVDPGVVIELRNARRRDAVSAPVADFTDTFGGAELLMSAAIETALEERIALTLAVDELGERERVIVLATFGADLTQSEIARRLGLSQSHVSKLLSRALERLGHLVT